MKALSVRQPWAWAIIHGGKDIENRRSRTNYRGSLLIHASTYSREWEIRQDLTLVAQRLPSGVEWPRMGELRENYGMVIGVVDLVDCRPAVSGTTWGFDAVGGWHWHLANPRPIQPFLARGKLGLWECEYADS